MRLPPSASPFKEEVGLLLQVDSGGEKGKSIEWHELVFLNRFIQTNLVTL